jgi:large subunit ribosomal protein L21
MAAPMGATKKENEMYAVIKTGGKQYRVAANDTIEIEKLEGSAGDSVEFTDVLMVSNGEAIEWGAPIVQGATVAGEIVGQVRGPKIVIFKKRRRKHYRRKNGHRQDLTSVRITEILTGGAKPAPRAAAEPAKTAEAAEAPAAPVEALEAKSDDLSLIAGVGPKKLRSLSALGYTSFAQIAALTPEEIETIETALKAKGSIVRDEWIEQAQELMAGKPPRAKADKAKAKD